LVFTATTGSFTNAYQRGAALSDSGSSNKRSFGLALRIF